MQAERGFRRKERVRRPGQRVLRHERDINVQANGIIAVVKNEQFTYSRALDTCLVHFEVTEFGVGTSYNIVDTLTTEKLFVHLRYIDQGMQASWEQLCKVGNECLGEEEFRKKRLELFQRTN
jgi:hypothetical protein